MSRSNAPPENVTVVKTRIQDDGRPTIFPPCYNKIVVKDFSESDIGEVVFQQTKDDNKLGLSSEDKSFLELMDKEFVQDEQGEWTAPLPFRHPRHPKKPDKIRGVFDSSAKYEGISLNQVLMTGPDLVNRLLGVLLRFRREEVVISCDIEQMFYSFSVREDHRNYLRFIWYEDNDPSKKLIEYRMCKHVFGNSPSPAVASYGLRKTVEQCETEFGSDVRQFVDKNFYVDDGLVSVPTAREAISLLDRTQKALGIANIRLHKFSSNCKEVLNAFASGDLAPDLKQLEFSTDALPTQRSLGLCWELETDDFTFNVSSSLKPYTRRGVLSTINSLYDPLGFLSPVTIQGKVLLRDMVSETTDRDEPLPNEFKESWERWESSLHDLNIFKVPRKYTSSANKEAELHIYSDASQKVISAVAFFKSLNRDVRSRFSFVFGKSKVAPKHGHTIPRLELCAAVLAVEIAETLTDELSLSREQVTFHTDSKVVLGYISNQTRRFYVYVANRVSRILKFSKPSQWCYVSTADNPADVGTRYISPTLLEESVWIQGPKESGPKEAPSNFPLVAPEDDSEIRPGVAPVIKTSVQETRELRPCVTRFEKFSKRRNLVSAISFLKRAIRRVKHKDRKNDISSEIHDDAETFIVKEVQREFYGGDISKCPKELSPFSDEKGLLRVGGRLRKSGLPLEERNPILIPGRSHIATLLTRHFHEAVHHQGRHLTEGAIRSAGFWITGGKRLVSYMLHHCVKCRTLRGTTCHQKMADLPSDRLTPSPPFTYVGVDVFGPWNIVTRRTRGGSANSKRWAVLFTCLTTRAIHIELIEEMTSSSFINAVRRLQSVRGMVKEFRSDRGTNFVGATDELKIDAIKVEDGAVKTLLHDSGTVWRFNPPHSSHMGGSWERMIGLVRNVLNSCLLDEKGKDLTHEVLSTFMCEVMAIVNARSMVPVSSDPDSPFILTPSILLTQKTDSPVETFVHPDVKEMYKSQWKHVQVLSDRFWKRWRSEFLPTLQQRRKWHHDKPNVKEGDVVLLQDKALARNDWPVGIVNRVFPSDDDLVRKVEVRIIRDGKSVNFVRPVVNLVKLVDVP